MSKQPTAPDPFASIDPQALGQVSGGAGAGASSEVMQALSGIADSIESLANQRPSGFGPTEMMMFMMMMSGGQAAAPAAAQDPFAGYAGYTIDGVYYPFR